MLVDIPKDVLQEQTTFSWPPELQLPEGEILLASEPGITTTLPPNTAAWIKRGVGR